MFFSGLPRHQINSMNVQLKNLKSAKWKALPSISIVVPNKVLSECIYSIKLQKL